MWRPGIWLPPRPFGAILARRAAVLWLLVRLTLLLFGGLEYLHPALPTSVAVVLLASWLTLLDAARRHETVLLANLGIGRPGLFAAVGAPPLLLECAAWLLVP